MLTSFQDIQDDLQGFDVCIVGGGAVGLSLAAALGDQRLRIAVLEAGGHRETRQARDALKGEVLRPSSHPMLHHYRVRALGGSSRVWGGRLMPYDAVDFARRPWAPGRAGRSGRTTAGHA